MATITEHEERQVKRANASGRQPVVFIHGLWLLPSSWDRWAAAFKKAGYTTLTPGWPDDPETVQDGTLKTYKGFPHGMPTTQAETINADLLAFVQS